MKLTTDQKFMRLAIAEAKKAKGPKRFGAVIVKGGKVVARGHNTTYETGTLFSCAESNALIQAGNKLKNRKLEGCSIYATGESCLICAGAIIKSRIKKVFVGFSHDDYRKLEKRKALKSWSKHIKTIMPKDIKIKMGLLRKECLAIMPNPKFN